MQGKGITVPVVIELPNSNEGWFLFQVSDK